MSRRLLPGSAIPVAVMAGVATLTLAGCTATTPEAQAEQLYSEAQAIYTPYKTRITEAQQAVWDGEWNVTTYGDFPQVCQGELGQREGTYQFVTSVYIPNATDIIGDDLQAQASGFAQQLEVNGWSDVSVAGADSAEPDVVRVSASDTSHHVERLTVHFDGGVDGTGSSVRLRASTECGDGGALDLMDLMFPDVELPDEPLVTTPSDPMRFGFDEAGEPVILTPSDG